MRSRIHYPWVLLFIAAGLGVSSAGALQGCDENGEIIYTCEDPIIDRKDHNGRDDPCCRVDPCDDRDAGADADVTAEGTESSDAGDGGPPCSGVCVDERPPDWNDPSLVWFGPPGGAPECPENAKASGFSGFEGFEADPATCACICTPSSGGTCGLTTTFTASSKVCYGAPAVLTPFNAPANWDGSCTTFDAIPAGALCNGVPCVRSITASSLVVTSEPTSCVPLTIEPLMDIAPPKVKSAVRECRPSLSFCGDTGVVCAPTAPGFKTCIYQKDDNACPAPYSDKHVVAKNFEDDRGCTACSCGPPWGGYCKATLKVFTDGACTSELSSTPIGSPGPACFDSFPPGVALGSKRITDLQYVPGSCAVTGGASVGGVTPTGTATFCCLP